MLFTLKAFKDYTQTSHNKLSSARTWSVQNIRFNKKITKLIVWWVASLKWLWHTCGVVAFESDQKTGLLVVKLKLLHRMAISYPSEEFETILWQKEPVPKTQVYLNCIWGQHSILLLFGLSRSLWIFLLHLIMLRDQVLADENLFSEVCV